jgi:hypothetical protein
VTWPSAVTPLGAHASFLRRRRRGVSLTATHLLYARVSPGDPGGCQEHSTILRRYRLSDHRVEQATQRDLLTGFAALHDGDAIEVRAPETHDGTCTNHLQGTGPGWDLVLTGPLTFAPVGAWPRAGGVGVDSAPPRQPTPGDGANAPSRSGPMICWRTASCPM